MASNSIISVSRLTKKNYSQQLLVIRKLNGREAKLEKETLKKRKEIIEDGTMRMHLRIGDLKLYENLGETWQEVELSKNEISWN